MLSGVKGDNFVIDATAFFFKKIIFVKAVMSQWFQSTHLTIGLRWGQICESLVASSREGEIPAPARCGSVFLRISTCFADKHNDMG